MTGLNPWVILGIVLAFVGVSAGAYVKGGADTRNRIEAQVARESRIHQAAYDAALRSTAEVIVKTEAIHNEIQQKVRAVIREVPAYRDCKSSSDIARLLDDARANRAPDLTVDHPGMPGNINADSAR